MAALKRRSVLASWTVAFATFSSVWLAFGSAFAQAPDAAQPPAAPPQPPAAGPAAPAPTEPPATPPTAAAQAPAAPLAAEPPAAESPANGATPETAAQPPGATLPEAAPATTGEAADTAGPDTALGAITITARHRTENIQEVPIAVTHLSAKDLEARGSVNLRDVQLQVPSLQILGFNPRNITIQIRGLGTTAGTVNSGIEPGVGVYMNGVYYARPMPVSASHRGQRRRVRSVGPPADWRIEAGVQRGRSI